MHVSKVVILAIVSFFKIKLFKNFYDHFTAPNMTISGSDPWIEQALLQYCYQLQKE